MRPIMAKAINYMKPDIDPNLRLYVPFNEGIGSVAKDYSQYCNHAALTGVEWSPEGGKFNGAYGNCGNDASLNITDAITVEVWVKKTAQVNYAGIVEKGGGNKSSGFKLRSASGSTISFMIYDTGWRSANVSMSSGVWHHLVGVFKGSATKVLLYLDGVKTEAAVDTGSIVSNSYPIYIGNDQDYVATRGFNGIIKGVRIYNRVLSTAQIAADCYEAVCS